MFAPDDFVAAWIEHQRQWAENELERLIRQCGGRSTRVLFNGELVLDLARFCPTRVQTQEALERLRHPATRPDSPALLSQGFGR